MPMDERPERLGFSSCMGPKLRRYVEQQLMLDLQIYVPPGMNITPIDIRFDWSDSCIEGHCEDWLDGKIENFSGVAIVDLQNRLVAEGWMEFIKTATGLEVFWWFLQSGKDYDIQSKDSNHVPKHIWDRMSDDARSEWVEFAPPDP